MTPAVTTVIVFQGDIRTSLLEFGNVFPLTPVAAPSPRRTEEAIGWLGRQIKRFKHYHAAHFNAIMHRIERFQNEEFISRPLKLFGAILLFHTATLYLHSKPLIPLVFAGMWGTAWAVSSVISRVIFPPILNECRVQAQEEESEIKLRWSALKRQAQQVIQDGIERINCILWPHMHLRDIPILNLRLDINDSFKNSLSCPIAMGKNDLAPFLSLRIRSKPHLEKSISFITLRPLINVSSLQAFVIQRWALYEEKEAINSLWEIAIEKDPFVILEQLVTNTHPDFELDFPETPSATSIPG
jgi:hypothetical protein